MANALYNKAKESFLGAGINLTSDTIKVVLVSSAYTFSAADQFLTSVSGVVATSGALTGKTITNGTFSASNITLTAVTGATITQIVIFKDTGSAATSPLIAYFDTGVTGLPVAPNGGDLTLQWSGSGIFAL